MSYRFLSEEWMIAAKEIHAKYAGQAPPIEFSVRLNQVITEVPFGDGTVTSYFDTSSGAVHLDLGQLDDPDVTITTDYATAQAIFVDADAAAGMQAFMAGKVKVQGDMMKLMGLQAGMPTDEVTRAIAAEIQAITASVDDG